MRLTGSRAARDADPLPFHTPPAVRPHRTGSAVNVSPMLAVAAASHSRAGDVRPTSALPSSAHDRSAGTRFSMAAERAMQSSHNLGAHGVDPAGMGMAAQALYLKRYAPRDEAEAEREALAAAEAAAVVRRARELAQDKRAWRRSRREHAEKLAREAEERGDLEAAAKALAERPMSAGPLERARRWKPQSKKQLKDSDKRAVKGSGHTWKHVKYLPDAGRNTKADDAMARLKEAAVVTQLQSMGNLPPSQLAKLAGMQRQGMGKEAKLLKAAAARTAGGSTRTGEDRSTRNGTIAKGSTTGVSVGHSSRGATAAAGTSRRSATGTRANDDDADTADVLGAYITSPTTDAGHVPSDSAFAVSPREAALEPVKQRGFSEPLLLVDGHPQLRAAVRCAVVNRLSELVADHANIDDDGAVELALALRRNTALRAVSLRHNRIMKRGVEALRRVLADNTTLEALDLSYNPLDDAGVIEMAGVVRVNSTLKSLGLVECEMGEAGVVALSLAVVMYNTTLVQLGLGAARPLMVSELAHGSPRPAVRPYEPWEWVPPSGRAADPEFAIRDVPVSLLEVMFLAQALSLNAHNLMRLDLINTQLSDAGIAFLANGLQHNTSLLSLRLTRNETMGRLGVVQLARGLRHNTALRSLRLDVHDLPVQELLGTATDLTLNGAYVPDGTKWLDRARLRRHGCQLSVLDTVLITEFVKYNPAVERLSINDHACGNHIGEGVSFMLERNTSLHTLALCRNEMEASGMVAMVDTSWPATNKSLTSLSLRDNCIGEQGAVALAEALGVNETITHLDVAGNAIADAGAQAIFEVITVTRLPIVHLDLSNNGLTHAAGVSAGTLLRTNTTLEHLAMNYNSLGTVGLTAIAVGARVNVHFKSLQLVNNGITTRGVQEIVNMLQVNRVVRTIMLQHNPLCNGSRQEAQMKQLLYLANHFHTVWDFRKGRVTSGVRVWGDGSSLAVDGSAIKGTCAEGEYRVDRHPVGRRLVLFALLLFTMVTPLVCTAVILDVAWRIPVGINKAWVPAMWVVATSVFVWAVHVRVFPAAAPMPVPQPELAADAGRLRRCCRWCCMRPSGHATPVMTRMVFHFLVFGKVAPVRVDLRSSDVNEVGTVPGMLTIAWLACYNAFAVCIPMFLLVTYAVFRWGATHMLLYSGAYFLAYPVLVMSGEDMRVVWRHHKNATHKRHEMELLDLPTRAELLKPLAARAIITQKRRKHRAAAKRKMAALQQAAVVKEAQALVDAEAGEAGEAKGVEEAPGDPPATEQQPPAAAGGPDAEASGESAPPAGAAGAGPKLKTAPEVGITMRLDARGVEEDYFAVDPTLGYDTDDSLMDKERPLPADPGEDTDEEVTDKKALAKALKLPFRPLWWAALSLLRLGELSSRCLLFALMVVKAEILGVFVILAISLFCGYNHFGRDSPEGWFRCPPHPSWSIDPKPPRRLPKDEAGQQRLELRLQAREAAEKVAIQYRIREVFRQWTAIWVSVFFYPSFSRDGCLVLVEERRAAWQQPPKVFLASRAFEYGVYCAWLGFASTTPQQNTRGWHLALYGLLTTAVMFPTLHFLLTRALWRRAEVGPEVQDRWFPAVLKTNAVSGKPHVYGDVELPSLDSPRLEKKHKLRRKKRLARLMKVKAQRRQVYERKAADVRKLRPASAASSVYMLASAEAFKAGQMPVDGAVAGAIPEEAEVAHHRGRRESLDVAALRSGAGGGAKAMTGIVERAVTKEVGRRRHFGTHNYH